MHSDYVNSGELKKKHSWPEIPQMTVTTLKTKVLNPSEIVEIHWFMSPE